MLLGYMIVYHITTCVIKFNKGEIFEEINE